MSENENQNKSENKGKNKIKNKDRERNSKKGDLLGICIVIAAFIIAFTPPKRPKTKADVNRYQYHETTNDIYLLDSHSGNLWIKGGELNGVTQWIPQQITNLQTVPKKHRETRRFQLKFTQKGDCYLLDTSSGKLWLQGGTLNGVVQWVEQQLQIPDQPQEDDK